MSIPKLLFLNKISFILLLPLFWNLQHLFINYHNTDSYINHKTCTHNSPNSLLQNFQPSTIVPSLWKFTNCHQTDPQAKPQPHRAHKSNLQIPYCHDTRLLLLTITDLIKNPKTRDRPTRQRINLFFFFWWETKN